MASDPLDTLSLAAVAPYQAAGHQNNRPEVGFTGVSNKNTRCRLNYKFYVNDNGFQHMYRKQNLAGVLCLTQRKAHLFSNCQDEVVATEGGGWARRGSEPGRGTVL